MADLDLHELIDAHLDGSITAEAFDLLANRLRSDRDAARAFARRCVDHRALRQMHTGASVAAGATLTPSPARSPFTLTTAAFAVAAALLLAAAAVVLYLVAMNTPPRDIAPPEIERRVATLIESTGPVTVNNDFANEGGEYASGTYSTQSGSAQFVLTNRVTVEMAGRTELVMHDDMHAELNRGTAVFNCPAGAEGYTVQLPRGVRVVDLGTRFRVTVDDNGNATVKVAVGRVAVVQDGGDRHELTPDLAAAVTGGRVDVFEARSIPLMNESFAAGGGSNAIDPTAIVDEGLDYPRLAATRGALRLADDQPVFIDLDTGVGSDLKLGGVVTEAGDIGRDGSTVWLSWVTRGQMSPTDRGYAGLSLFLDSEDAHRSSYTFFGVHAQYGVVAMPGTTGAKVSGRRDFVPLATIDRLRPVGERAHLWVVRIDFAAQADTVRIYYDPDLSAGEPDKPNAEFTLTDVRFDRIRLINKTLPARPHAFDELRLGATWDAVVPRSRE